MRIWISGFLLTLLATATLGACGKKDQPAADPVAAAPVPAEPAKPTEAKTDEAKADEAKPTEAKADEAKPADLAGAADKPADAAPTGDTEAIIEAGVKAFEDMSKLMGAGKDNCDKLGTDLTGFMEKNGETLTAFRKTMEGLDPAAGAALQAKYEKRMEASMTGFMEGGMACRDHAGVKAAMVALTGEPTDAPDMPEMGNMEIETPVVQKLSDIVKAAGSDCAKLDTALKPFVESDAADLKAFITKMQAAEPVMNGDTMALVQIMPALQECEETASVTALKAIFMAQPE